MPTPTPRDLDPNFKDANVPDNADDTVTQEDKQAEEPEDGFIVMKTRFVDSAGNVGEKVHGPMPRSEWAAYSKKNGL